MSARAWQDIKNIVSLFHSFGGKEQVLLHPALCPSYLHFSGVVFSVFETSGELRRGHRGQRRHRTRLVPVAVGGRSVSGMVCSLMRGVNLVVSFSAECVVLCIKVLYTVGMISC